LKEKIVSLLTKSYGKEKKATEKNFLEKKPFDEKICHSLVTAKGKSFLCL